MIPETCPAHTHTPVYNTSNMNELRWISCWENEENTCIQIYTVKHKAISGKKQTICSVFFSIPNLTDINCTIGRTWICPVLRVQNREFKTNTLYKQNRFYSIQYNSWASLIRKIHLSGSRFATNWHSDSNYKMIHISRN